MFGFSRSEAKELAVGDPAPDFTAPASDGSTVHLKDQLGKGPIVLYFYPKDDTPGCTKEACGIRDDFGPLRNLKATVYGVSYDSVASHQAFVKKYNLPFVLLADEKHALAKAYGADSLLFAKRQSFVINPEGKIVYVNRSVSPATHSAELQKVLSTL